MLGFSFELSQLSGNPDVNKGSFMLTRRKSPGIKRIFTRRFRLGFIMYDTHVLWGQGIPLKP